MLGSSPDDRAATEWPATPAGVVGLLLARVGIAGTAVAEITWTPGVVGHRDQDLPSPGEPDQLLRVRQQDQLALANRRPSGNIGPL